MPGYDEGGRHLGSFPLCKSGPDHAPRLGVMLRRAQALAWGRQGFAALDRLQSKHLERRERDLDGLVHAGLDGRSRPLAPIRPAQHEPLRSMIGKLERAPDVEWERLRLVGGVAEAENPASRRPGRVAIRLELRG